MRLISDMERQHRWWAANDDTPGAKRPPRPFFLSRFWRFELPFGAFWISIWAAYFLMRGWL